MSTYLTNQNAVLSAPGLTGAAVMYPKTIPQLAAVGNKFLPSGFSCFLQPHTRTTAAKTTKWKTESEG